MTIHVIPGKGYDSNIFVIDGTQPTIIDSGTGLHPKQIEKNICSYINPTTITQILLTHEHYDHTGGSKHLLDLTGNNAKLIAHPYTKEKVEKGESMFASMLGGQMPKITIDTPIQGGEQLLIGNHYYEVLYTPGHSPGCICFYCKEQQVLFSGDTVFAFGSFGRTDFPGGSLFHLQQSIQQLTQLTVDALYPGHETCIQKDASHHLALSYQNVCSLG